MTVAADEAEVSPEPEGACLAPLDRSLQFWMGVVPGPWVYACLKGPRSVCILLAWVLMSETE